MALLTKRSVTTIKELFGRHRNLHPHIEALQDGRETTVDIDVILEELEYYIEKKANFLDPFTLAELQDAIKRLRNN